jgi:lysophospholipase L1-like esterase
VIIGDRRGNVWLAVLSTLLTLLAIESGLRLFARVEDAGLLDARFTDGVEPPADGPADLGHLIRLSRHRRVVYELKPGLDVTYAGVRVRTNGQGLRSPHAPEDFARAGLRVVGLGDSFMFGYGVTDEEPYLAVLERLTRERLPRLDARFLNTAVPGYNTVMEVETLEEKALAYRPQLVILEFVGNDLELPNFVRRKRDVLTLRRSFLADLVKGRRWRSDLTFVQKLAEHGLEPAPVAEGVPAELRDMVGWEAYAQALRQLLRLSREQGFEVLSICLAEPDSLNRRALELATDLGFRVVDLAPTFRKYLADRGIAGSYLGSPLALGPDDGHPSALGHEVAARALFRYLRHHGLLERRSEITAARTPATG